MLTRLSGSQIATNFLAINALLSITKLFKYLRFHRGLSQFVETIYDALFEVSVFLFIMGVIMVSFALSFHVAFGHVATPYMDFAESLFTLFKSTMGQFTIREIQEVNSSGRYLGPFLFISFIVVNMFVVLSMLFAMVNMSFKHVRDELLGHEVPKAEDIPVVMDITRCLNGALRMVGYIPGIPQKDFTEQSIRRRRKRIAKMLSGESELVRMNRKRMKQLKDLASGKAGRDDEASMRADTAEAEDELKRMVSRPRRDLLKQLVEVEAAQRQMLNNIESLSRQVRAQTFDRINKEMEDLVEGAK